MDHKIPFYLITGFLGSGKTTFIQSIIDYFHEKKKIAIIQNEFAPANFDGKELKRLTNKEFDLLEINNGSVFCICLLSGFIDSMEKFLEQCHPEVIFMEASGLSDPVGIGEILNSEKLGNRVYLAGTICIIDANNFLKLEPIQQRVKHQVMIADHVIINKSDLSEHLDIIKVKVEELNPLGIKYITNYCLVPLDEVLNMNTEKDDKSMFIIERSGRPDIHSVVLKTSKQISHDRFDEFINIITKDVIRMKGYIIMDNGESLAINSIYSEVKTEILKNELKQTELIAIGYNLNIRAFKEKYLLYT